jgi:hypothetical protein
MYAAKRAKIPKTPKTPKTPKSQVTKMSKTKRVSYNQEEPVVKVYSRDELCSHILTDHKVSVAGYGVGYEFEFVFDNNHEKPIRLDKYQNLEMNVKYAEFKKNPKMKSFSLFWDEDLLINLENGEVERKEKPELKSKIKISSS